MSMLMYTADIVPLTLKCIGHDCATCAVTDSIIIEKGACAINTTINK